MLLMIQLMSLQIATTRQASGTRKERLQDRIKGNIRNDASFLLLPLKLMLEIMHHF